MALTTSNAKEILVDRYYEGLTAQSDAYRQIFSRRGDNAASIRVAAIHGVGTVPSWDGSSDLTTTNVDSLGSTTFSYSVRGVQVRLSKYDVADIPELPGFVARKLGLAVAATQGSLAAAVYDGIWATHTTYDGQYLIADAHTTASGASRDNKLTSAFDRDALFAAIKQARQWVSYHNLPADLADMGWYLVCGPGLEQTVREVLGSAYSGSDLQINAANAFDVTPVIWNQVADADNWALVSKATTGSGEGPLLWWDRKPPLIDSPVIDEDNGTIKLNVDFAYACGVLPTPDGIIGAAV